MASINPKTHQNFEVFEAEEFLAAITQHIPDRGFHIVRYFGWYSGAAKGRRRKASRADQADAADVEVIDVSSHRPKKVPSKKWRQLIHG